MAQVIVERHTFASPLQVFDLEDQFARNRRVLGEHPRPYGSLRFFIVGQVLNGQPQPLERTIELVVEKNPGGYHIFFGQMRYPGEKTVYRSFLDAGRYVFRIEGDFYQPREYESDLPLADAAAVAVVDLLPSYAYPFPGSKKLQPTLLRGHVQDAQGRGLNHAQVNVVGMDQIFYSETDDSGQWVLVFPDDQPSGDVTIRLTWEGAVLGRTAHLEPKTVNALPPVTWP